MAAIGSPSVSGIPSLSSLSLSQTSSSASSSRDRAPSSSLPKDGSSSSRSIRKTHQRDERKAEEKEVQSDKIKKLFERASTRPYCSPLSAAARKQAIRLGVDLFQAPSWHLSDFPHVDGRVYSRLGIDRISKERFGNFIEVYRRDYVTRLQLRKELSEIGARTHTYKTHAEEAMKIGEIFKRKSRELQTQHALYKTIQANIVNFKQTIIKRANRSAIEENDSQPTKEQTRLADLESQIKILSTQCDYLTLELLSLKKRFHPVWDKMQKLRGGVFEYGEFLLITKSRAITILSGKLKRSAEILKRNYDPQFTG